MTSQYLWCYKHEQGFDKKYPSCWHCANGTEPTEKERERAREQAKERSRRRRAFRRSRRRWIDGGADMDHEEVGGRLGDFYGMDQV